MSKLLASKNESSHQKAMRIMHLFTNFHSGGQIQEVSDSFVGFTGCVRTEAVQYPQRKSCGFKDIRIRVDGV